MTPPTVTFYHRQTETTFTTDPTRVAAAFLESPMSRRIRETSDPTARALLLRHLDGPLSRYLQLKGATHAAPQDPDPHRTRQAYDTVYALVRDHLTSTDQP